MLADWEQTHLEKLTYPVCMHRMMKHQNGYMYFHKQQQHHICFSNGTTIGEPILAYGKYKLQIIYDHLWIKDKEHEKSHSIVLICDSLPLT